MKRIIKSVTLLLTLFILAHVVLGEDGVGGAGSAGGGEGNSGAASTDDKNPGDTEPPEPMFNITYYSTKVDSALQCWSSKPNFCEWQENKFKLDIFDKLRTDEWQLCSD